MASNPMFKRRAIQHSLAYQGLLAYDLLLIIVVVVVVVDVNVVVVEAFQF